MIYDVSEKRVSNVLKICRKYLSRIQNSVFEGEIDDGSYVSLKKELLKSIDKNFDSIVIYKFKFKPIHLLVREEIGVSKGNIETVI